MIKQDVSFYTGHSRRQSKPKTLDLLLAASNFKQRINFLDGLPVTMLLILNLDLLIDIITYEIQQRLKTTHMLKDQFE